MLLRPEQIELADAGAPALVTAVEFHGSTGIAHVTSGDCVVTVRCPAHVLPAPGAQVKLRVRGTALLVAS